MNKPILTLDVDGVMADGRAARLWPNVTAGDYLALPPADGYLRDALHMLELKYTLYAVTARSFPGAVGLTSNWLGAQGVRGCFTGVIANHQNLTPGAVFKIPVLDALGADVHVDDDPRICAAVAGAGRSCLLYVNPDMPPLADEFTSCVPVFSTWRALTSALLRRAESPV